MENDSKQKVGKKKYVSPSAEEIRMEVEASVLVASGAGRFANKTGISLDFTDSSPKRSSSPWSGN